MASGPLNGIKIVEFAGIGPGPFCGMLLSDMGADIIRIDRKGGYSSKAQITERGRKSVTLNLKNDAAKQAVLKLLVEADALIEGFRPGVMERLGLGPDIVHGVNPKLVYGRMTGWGQYGPLSHAAGHDINYISVTGALHAMGEADRPPAPPLNLVGDFGGGALYLAMGICAALLHAKTTGEGQVIDCAMTDGTASLMAMFYGMKASGIWEDKRESNLLDGAAHFYGSYECADGKYVSLGSIEPQFYALLREKAGLSGSEWDAQMDKAAWPDLNDKIKAVMKTKTRDEWCEIMEGTDICFGPILSLEEAPKHPHNVERETFIERDGIVQPAPAPRFSATPTEVQFSPASIGEHNDSALAEWGFSKAEIEALRTAEAL